MARIRILRIKHYRGVKELTIEFGAENLTCLIGRGDSGKTTILEAISNVLSPSWNLTFNDTDFYNCDVGSPIEIEASISDFPERLLSDEKYGFHVRSINVDTSEISDEPISDNIENIIPILTIKLVVDNSLEPEWVVVNTRDQEEVKISASDRATLSCTLVSDYIDRHFSWNKGNPLYSIQNKQESADVSSNKNVVIDSLRQAKTKIDDFPFDELEESTILIKDQASKYGLDISAVQTTLDFKELSIKDGRISLHENAIPFRLKGKGSKRLASFAIQSALCKDGGIMLVDEIEQGLEPDRVKQIVRVLKDQKLGQIILTTHSREAVTELGASNLLLCLKGQSGEKTEARRLTTQTDGLQKSIRACPEAFFAKKVIVCEGATEVGICRAMDEWRVKYELGEMSFKDCAYVDGTGSTLVERALEINRAGLSTALLCDSDDKDVNGKKEIMISEGIEIFDCDSNYCIEQQIFSDLPWDGVQALLTYIKKHSSDSFNDIFSEYAIYPIEDWEEKSGLREAIIAGVGGKAGQKWFKAVHHGQFLGKVVFSNIDELDSNSHLCATLTKLRSWIDN